MPDLSVSHLRSSNEWDIISNTKRLLIPAPIRSKKVKNKLSKQAGNRPHKCNLGIRGDEKGREENMKNENVREESFINKGKIINNEKDPKPINQKTSSSIHPPPPTPPTALTSRPLRQNLPQPRIAPIDTRMVHPHMALQIIGSRIPVFSVAGAERADIAW